MNDFASRLRASWWWLLPLAVLLLAIGLETDWGGAVRKRLPGEEPIAPKPVEIALLPEYAIVGGVAARRETVERTLFNPTRRPAPVAQGPGASQLQRGQFALSGTTVVDGKNTAFLRETAGGKSRRVVQGQSINGMLVAEVRPDRVRLTLGDEAEELVLKVATNPRPTPPPAAPTAAGAAPTPTPPVAATPAMAAGAPAAAPAPQGTPQSLAERRRAARAAEAAAASAGSPPAAPQAAAPPATPASTPAAQPIDPGWEAMSRAYRERAAQQRK